MYKNGVNVCITCGSKLPPKSLLKMRNMPASAQDIPNIERINQDEGIALDLYQCNCCGLVQFDCEPVSYYRDVIRSGGFSTTMVELRRNQYQYLIEKYGLQKKKFIEIGCGQGEFLKVLTEFDVEAYGIEHRNDLVEKAKHLGLRVWQDFAKDKDTVLKSPNGVQQYDVFLSFNFLEHQPYAKDMMECIYHNLSNDGMGLITVPSLEYILEHDGYYELIRDHLAYYSFETLEVLLNQSGFEVLEQKIINRDTLSVIVKKSPVILEKHNINVKRADVSGLKRSEKVINGEINDMIVELQKQGQSLAIWGASHQGFTLAATTDLKNFASYIIDSAPFKQGKYAPASHLSIVSPQYWKEKPVDVILIVAPGYTDEIIDIIKNIYEKKVKIVILKSRHLEYVDF